MRKLLFALLITATSTTPAWSQSARDLRQAAREKKAERADKDEARSEPRDRTQPRQVQVREPSLAPIERDGPAAPRSNVPSTAGSRPPRTGRGRGSDSRAGQIAAPTASQPGDAATATG